MLLILVQLRINGKCQQLTAGPFRFREIAFVIAECVETLLPMEGHRIIDFCPNAFGLEVGLGLVSIRHTDHELIVDMVMGNTGCLIHGCRQPNTAFFN